MARVLESRADETADRAMRPKHEAGSGLWMAGSFGLTPSAERTEVDVLFLFSWGPFMSTSFADQLRVPKDRKPRSVLVIPPKSVLDDELRLMRLGEALQAEFPDLHIVVKERNMLPGNQSAVGVLPNADGSSPFTPEETNQIMDEVSEAMQAFVDMHRRAMN